MKKSMQTTGKTDISWRNWQVFLNPIILLFANLYIHIYIDTCAQIYIYMPICIYMFLLGGRKFMQPSLSKAFLEKNEPSTYFLLQLISNLAIFNSKDTSTKDSRFSLTYHWTKKKHVKLKECFSKLLAVFSFDFKTHASMISTKPKFKATNLIWNSVWIQDIHGQINANHVQKLICSRSLVVISFNQRLKILENMIVLKYVNLKTHAVLSFKMFTYSKEMKRQNVHFFKNLAIDFKIGK